MDDEIDLRDIVHVFWKSRFLIGGTFLVAILAATAISFALPLVYEVSSIVALGNFGDPIYTTQGSAQEIMLSDGFLLDVAKPLNISSSEFKSFKSSIKIEPVKGSDNLLVISVETQDRQEGMKIIENIIKLFVNRSEESYSRQRKILLDQLASAQMRLMDVGNDTNQTRGVLKDLREAQGPSSEENELRFSRTLEYLNGEETRRSTLLDSYLSLQKQLYLLKNTEVVQEAREPVTPIKPQRTLVIAIAGMLGLMMGILAAFLREGIKKPSEKVS